MSDMSLLRDVEMGRSYIVITARGKEYNMVVMDCSDGVLYGRVARNCMVELKKNGEVVAETIQNFEHADVSTKDLLGVEHCTMSSSQMLTIKLADVSVIEEPWRLFVPPSVASVGQDGNTIVVLDQGAILKMFPRLEILKNQLVMAKPVATQDSMSSPPMPIQGASQIISFPKKDAATFIPGQQ